MSEWLYVFSYFAVVIGGLVFLNIWRKLDPAAAQDPSQSRLSLVLLVVLILISVFLSVIIARHI